MREAHRVLAIPLHDPLHPGAATDRFEEQRRGHSIRPAFGLLHDGVRTEAHAEIEGQADEAFVAYRGGFTA
jgi:hypothetical protein